MSALTPPQVSPSVHLMLKHTASWALLACLIFGCETDPFASDPQPKPADQTSRPQAQTHDPPASNGSGPLAYVAGQPVTDRDLREPLIEAAGGQVLSEIVLDRMVSDRLKQRGMELTADLIDREKSLMLLTLSPDPDEAARLMIDLRSDRGLGERRFASMLYRNAGLRLLIRDDVHVSTRALHQAFRLRYGQRYRVRVIVTDRLADAKTLRSLALAGEAFGELAALHSTDPSAAQGGLLSPISPVDPSYPKALRDALTGLDPGGISDLIAADEHFIIIKLEEIQPADAVEFADVKDDLEQAVRLEAQGQLMLQAARSMLSEAKVVVLDPALDKSWRAEQAKAQSE